MQIPVGLEQNRMQKGKCKREAAEGQNYAASAGRSNLSILSSLCRKTGHKLDYGLS